jgi:hypothetical protein
VHARRTTGSALERGSGGRAYVRGASPWRPPVGVTAGVRGDGRGLVPRSALIPSVAGRADTSASGVGNDAATDIQVRDGGERQI